MPKKQEQKTQTEESTQFNEILNNTGLFYADQKNKLIRYLKGHAKTTDDDMYLFECILLDLTRTYPGLPRKVADPDSKYT